MCPPSVKPPTSWLPGDCDSLHRPGRTHRWWTRDCESNQFLHFGTGVQFYKPCQRHQPAASYGRVPGQLSRTLRSSSWWPVRKGFGTAPWDGTHPGVSVSRIPNSSKKLLINVMTLEYMINLCLAKSPGIKSKYLTISCFLVSEARVKMT